MLVTERARRIREWGQKDPHFPEIFLRFHNIVSLPSFFSCSPQWKILLLTMRNFSERDIKLKYSRSTASKKRSADAGNNKVWERCIYILFTWGEGSPKDKKVKLLTHACLRNMIILPNTLAVTGYTKIA